MIVPIVVLTCLDDELESIKRNSINYHKMKNMISKYIMIRIDDRKITVHDLPISYLAFRSIFVLIFV